MVRTGDFSHNNPARRRDSIRRTKGWYEQTERGKRIRKNNYIAKLNFFMNCKAQIKCQRSYYDENVHMETYCLEDDPMILTFHHVKPEDKKFLISGASVTRSWPDILKEISKCKVLCFNCHNRVHKGIWKKPNNEASLYKKDKEKQGKQLNLL